MIDKNELDGAILRNLLTQTTRAYERQMAELAAQRELAQVILASIGDAVVATDQAGAVRFVNPVAEALTGWHADRAVGKPLSQVLRLSAESGMREAAELVAACISSGTPLALPERMNLVHPDGRVRAVEGVLTPIRGAGGEILGAVFVLHDVTDRRLLALQLAHQASHDDLTGLLNRQAFDAHLERALAEVFESGAAHALAYLDLDRFKVVNDSCGHQAGDELLCAVTRLIQETLPATDLVARLGGDEFGVLLLGTPPAAAKERMRGLLAALKAFRFSFRDRRFAVGASLGLVPLSADIASMAMALSAADHACYVAKERGRGRLEVYRPDDDAFTKRQSELSWVGRIQEILDSGRCRLFAQPICPLSPRAARGVAFETLLRIDDGAREKGKIGLPADFIRAAERFGLIRSIDRWVIHHCLEALSAGPPPRLAGLATCSINLSASSLGDEELADYVLAEIAAARVPPDKVCFEITETAAIENLPLARRLFARLGASGVRFALDDFGAGLSSYGYLKEIPVSFLKIDGRFVQGIVTDPLDRAMVESIHQVGRAIGIQTVAESVSSAAICEHVKALGIDYAQGFWLAPPRPLGEAEAVPGWG